MITRLFNTQGGTIDFDSSTPCFIVTYTGHIVSEDFRSMNEFLLVQMSIKTKEYGNVPLIADLSRAEVFSDNDVKWAAEYFNPNVYNNGLRFFAIITPLDPFASINLADFISADKQNTHPFDIKLFGDLESAIKWCKEVLFAS